MRRYLKFMIVLLMFVVIAVPSFAVDISVNNPAVPAFHSIFKGENGNYSFDASGILSSSVADQERFKSILADIQGKNPDRIGIAVFSVFTKSDSAGAGLQFYSFDKNCTYRVGSTYVMLDVTNCNSVSFNAYDSMSYFRTVSSYEVSYANLQVYHSQSSVQPALFVYNPFKISLPAHVYQASDINSMDAYYSVNNRDLTIHYQYEDGTKAHDSYVVNLEKGKPYSVSSPQIADYVPDHTTVAGTMGDTDLTLTVIYSKIKHSLRVFYHYEDSTQAFETYTGAYAKGDSYVIPSPNLEGYTPSVNEISGTMANSDVSFTVTYKKNAPPPSSSEESSSSEPSSGSSSTGSEYVVWNPEIMKGGFQNITQQAGSAFNTGIRGFLMIVGIILSVKLVRSLMK